MTKENDYDYEIADYDSETNEYVINFNFTEDEYDEINEEYEKYLETKKNTEDAVSFDEFFDIVINIGLRAKQLEVKKEYLNLLKIEIEKLERDIGDYKLKL